MSDYVLEYWIEPMAELDVIMESYIELSPYQILFEADNPDVSQQMRQNANLEKQSDSAISKIIHGILNLISNIINTITTFFSKLFMNGNERAAFDEIEKKVQSMPGMENKKITMKDYKKLNAEFQRLDKESQAQIQKIENGQTPSMEVLNQMETFIKGGIVPGAMTIVTKIGLQAAKDDVATAKMISNMLSMDQNSMKSLESALGKREANKFKKKIDKLSTECLFYRKRVNMFGKHYNSLQENIMDTFQEFSKLLDGKLTMTNLGFLGSLFKNKKFRKNAAMPIIKQGAKEVYNKVHHDAYIKINGKDPSGITAAAGYVLGRNAKNQQQQPTPAN